MKRRVSFLVLISLIAATLTACAVSIAMPPAAIKEPPPIVESPAAPTPSASPDTPLVLPSHSTALEYGEQYTIVDNTGPLFSYIRYPQGNEFADEVISEWANSEYINAQDEIDFLRQTDSESTCEINISYDSYLVDDRFAGILEKGMFISSYMESPREIINAFNLDLERGVLLSNDEILDPEKSGDALSLLREKILNAYPDISDALEGMDDTWLNNLVIGHEGIVVVLERSYLPETFGTLAVTLPYDEVGAAVRLGADKIFEPDTPAEPATELESYMTEAEPAESPSALPKNNNIDPSKPMIALTFDDGPSRFTPRILDCLEKYGGRATFCVLGDLATNQADTVSRAFNMDCEIIGHTLKHRDLTKLSVDEIKKELLGTNAVIESITGVLPNMYRPPYGAINDRLINVSRDLGFSIIHWSVDTRDWQTRNSGTVYRSVMNNAQDRAIVLCHDLYGTTADAMERVIPELTAKGYQLVTVSELMYYSGKTLEAGIKYKSGN